VFFLYQLDLYTCFKATQPDVKVSFISFRRLCPFFFVRLKDFNSYCCMYHQQMAEITLSFNNMQSSKVHLAEGEQHCNCWCGRLCCNSPGGRRVQGIMSCQHQLHMYKRSTHLWEQTLYPKPAGTVWHSLTCLRGLCDECGFKKLLIYDRELDPANQRQMF
jgi:hypothetical protein